MGAQKIEVIIDWPRAERVFGLMLEALAERRWPYNIASQPHLEENLPKEMPRGSVEEARFFMAICYYMMGGIESDTALRALALTDDAKTSIQAEVRRVLSGMGLNRRSEQIAQQWTDNFTKLDTHWKGDPRLLFADTTDFATLCERLINGKKLSPDNPNGFYGFREKMVGMLAFFLMDRGLIPYYHIPPPIDFHALRILTGCGLLSVPDKQFGDNLYTQRYLVAARELTYGYCVRHDVSALRLCDCLWLLSRTGCRQHPGTRSKPGERQARRTVIHPWVYEWNKQWTRKYRQTCGQCPVEGDCLFTIPSANYYIQGKLIIRGKRDKPPQLGVFDTTAID